LINNCEKNYSVCPLIQMYGLYLIQRITATGHNILHQCYKPKTELENIDDLLRTYGRHVLVCFEETLR